MKIELAATPPLHSYVRPERTSRISKVGLGGASDAIATLAVLVSMFALPLAFFPRVEAAWTVPKTALLEASAVLAVAALLVKLFAGSHPVLRRSRLDIPIALYVGLALLGVLHAGSMDQALFGSEGRGGFITLISAVALYLVAYNLPGGSRLSRQAMATITVAMTLSSLEGIAEATGSSLIGLQPDWFGMRAYSTSGNPDFLGGLLVLAWPLPVALMGSTGRTRRGLWALCLGIMLATVALTHTRSAWVGSTAALAVLLALGRDSIRQNWRWLAAAGAMAIAVTLIVYAWSPKSPASPVGEQQTPLAASQPAPEQALAGTQQLADLSKALETPDKASAPSQVATPVINAPRSLLPGLQNLGASVSERLLIWQATLGVAADQPILGAGYGSLYSAITLHLGPDWSIDRPDTWVDKAHNVYLDHLATLGVTGLLAYLGLMGTFAVVVVSFLRREASAAQRALVAPLLAAWSGYLVHLFFLFDTADSIAIFWVVMAIALRETPRWKRTTPVTLHLPPPLRAAAALVVVGAALFAWIQAAQPVVAESYLRQAAEAGGFSQPEQAAVLYLKAAQTDPHSDLAQARAAAALMVLAEREKNPRSGRHLLDEAARLWSGAIVRDPNFAYLYAMRGETYTGYGNGEHLADALADFHRAVDLFPAYYVGWAGVADTSRVMGRLSDAIAAERKMAELDPADQDNLRFLAQDYVRASRWQEAIGTWQAIADLGGDKADVHLNMAQAYLMAGRKDLATYEWDKARTMDPGSDEVEKVRKMVQGDPPAAVAGH